MQENTAKPRKFETFLKIALYIVSIILVSIVFVTFIAQRTVVRGESMMPTYTDGAQVITSKISYRVHNPERYDVVVFFPQGDTSMRYIKRIMGLPGETVQIKDGNFYVNGKKIKDNLAPTDNAGLAEEKVTLAKDEYFVLGDNRSNSQDSRYIGPVKKEDIIGKVSIELYPKFRFAE